MRTVLSTLIALGLLAASAPAFAATSPTPAGPKVTWGRVARIQYQHDPRSVLRMQIATPSGPRTFAFPAESVPLRDRNNRLLGYADALRPGDQVRVFYRLDRAGHAQPLEFTPAPRQAGR